MPALRFLPIVLLALLLAACEGWRKRPGLLETVGILPPPPTDLSVMSFNIRYGTAADGPDHWDRRRSLALEAIAARAPDILGLQEALRFQIDDLRAAFPHYAETGSGRDDGRSAGEHCTILFDASRFRLDRSGNFWLSDTPEVPGSASWGNTITRICSWARLVELPDQASGPGGRAFLVFNTHLDHQSEAARQRSAELIASRILALAGPREPVILMGDFNCGEDSPALRFLTGRAPRAVDEPGPGPGLTARWTGLIDTFRAVNPDEAEVGTFHAFMGTTTGDKIDFILASREVRVRSASIVRDQRDGRYPSDHFPVTADLTISATTAAP
ncbi:MAG: endonuclease/exonuclease/phosphatase family protein [Phycisphaerales bacterium]